MQPDFLLILLALWLVSAALSIVLGLIRRFHWLQWSAASLVLGPLALVLSPFLTGKGYRTSLWHKDPARTRTTEMPDPPTAEELIYGRPFLGHEIRSLKRSGALDEAAELLLIVIDGVEEKARKLASGVPHWYYEQLAQIYQKQGERKKEIRILKRFSALPALNEKAAKRLSRRLDQAMRNAG